MKIGHMKMIDNDFARSFTTGFGVPGASAGKFEGPYSDEMGADITQGLLPHAEFRSAIADLKNRILALEKSVAELKQDTKGI